MQDSYRVRSGISWSSVLVPSSLLVLVVAMATSFVGFLLVEKASSLKVLMLVEVLGSLVARLQAEVTMSFVTLSVVSMATDLTSCFFFPRGGGGNCGGRHVCCGGGFCILWLLQQDKTW